MRGGWKRGWRKAGAAGRHLATWHQRGLRPLARGFHEPLGWGLPQQLSTLGARAATSAIAQKRRALYVVVRDNVEALSAAVAAVLANRGENVSGHATREGAGADELEWSWLLEPVEDRKSLAERDRVDDQAVLVD